MTERLEGLYSSDGHQCGCGGDSPSTGTQIARLAKSGDKDKHTPPEPRPSVSKKAYRWVYKAGGMKPEMLSDRPIRKMIEETSSSLSTALDEDIAQELTPEMRNALERDVFLFSGFKTYHNLKEASLLLENKERGGIQTFDEFYRSIRQIDDKYNRDWLRSEYQFAVNSAAMASQWEQALKDKDLYALQYVTVGDDRVRPEHAELDGLVLPMDDPFWRTGTPPNGWGCRCTVMQVPLEENPLTPQEQSDRSRAASSALNDMTEGKNSIFRFNPYYDQALFPPKHPYFGKKGYRHCSSDRFAHADGDANPCNIYRKLKETAEELQALIKQRRKQYKRLKANPDYIDTAFNSTNGGLKSTHKDHSFDKKKGWYEKRAQEIGFQNGDAVILGAEPQNVFREKKTEGTWNDLLFEVAGAETGTSVNIRNALKHCATKPEVEVAVVFFPFPENVSMSEIEDGVARYNGLKKTSQWKPFKQILFISNDGNIIQKKTE